MSQTTWQRSKDYSKKGLDKAWIAIDKLGRPVNRLSNKLGAETFWPTTLDKESDKAARILRSFCKDGFYEQHSSSERDNAATNGVTEGEDKTVEGPRGKQRVIKKIPASVIRQAKGLAIFTTMRAGLWVSGAGGNGVLLGRIKETGEWSMPSGITLHTAGLGFLVGVDIYDCVIVINTYEALEAFKSVRCTLGGAVSAVAGPVGAGGAMESEVHKRQAPVYSYLKSRGFYAGVQVNGTVVIERKDENERFYGEKVTVSDILAGRTANNPESVNTLLETIKAAQGDVNVNEKMLPPAGEAPGDADVSLGKIFGVPDDDDPDPYGVRALETEGIVIREAGTNRTASIDHFEFRPSPTSPIRSRFSFEGSRRSSWRYSIQSTTSVDRGTQTDDTELSPISPTKSFSPASRTSSISMRDKFSTLLYIPTELDEHKPAQKKYPHHRSASLFDGHRKAGSLPSPDIRIATTATNPTFSRAKIVDIPKLVPPPLPSRNPERVGTPTTSPSETSDLTNGTTTSVNGSLSRSQELELVVPENEVDGRKCEDHEEQWYEPPQESITPPVGDDRLIPNGRGSSSSSVARGVGGTTTSPVYEKKGDAP